MATQQQRLEAALLRRQVEAGIEPVIERALRRTVTRTLSANDLGTFASLNLTAAASPDRLGALLRAWQTEVDRSIVNALLAAWRLVTGRALAALPDDMQAQVRPYVRDVRAAALFGQIENRIVGVGQNAYEDVTDALRTTLEVGGSPQEAAAAVRHELGVTYRRSSSIARTETAAVIGSANLTVSEDLQSAGIEHHREWLATMEGCTPGGRTRPTHCAANGQIVGPGERFKVGDAELWFPADPTGPAEETIQCRCDTLMILDGIG